jgi:hypothetical protein
MVQHCVAIRVDRQLLHHHIRGYDTWNHSMSQFRSASYAESLRSWQSPSFWINSPPFVKCTDYYPVNNSPPLDKQSCEASPHHHTRYLRYEFAPVCMHDIILKVALWPWGDSASNRNEYQEYYLGGKGGRCVGLTTLPPSRADCLEIWEPRPPGTLRACPGL